MEDEKEHYTCSYIDHGAAGIGQCFPNNCNFRVFNEPRFSL